MKKSKFLKKSLAMLLALMLVVAMIPLSASAATTLPNMDMLYVNGSPVTVDGSNVFSDEIYFRQDYVTLRLNQAFTDAKLYVMQNNSDTEKKEVTADEPVLSLNGTNYFETSKYAQVENSTVTMKLVLVANDDPENKEEYTVKLSQVTSHVTASLASGAPVKNTGVYAVEVNNASQTVTVIAARGYTPGATTTGARITVTGADGATINGSTTATLDVPAYGTDSKFTVKSESGDNEAEYTIKVTVKDALQNFSIDGVEGVITDEDNDVNAVPDTVTVTLPKSSVLDETYNEPVKDPKLPVEFATYGNTAQIQIWGVADTSSTIPAAKKNPQVVKSSESAFFGLLTDSSNSDAPKEITSGAKLSMTCEGVPQEYDLVIKFAADTTTAINYAQLNDQVATIEGQNITAELPNTAGVLNDVKVTLRTPASVTKVVIGNTEADVPNPSAVNGEKTWIWDTANVNLNSSKIITVTAENGDIGYYNLSATVASNTTVARLTAVYLTNGDVKYEGQITDHTITFNNVPYMTPDIAGWKVFATPVAGANAAGVTTGSDGKDHADTANIVVNGTTKAVNLWDSNSDSKVPLSAQGNKGTTTVGKIAAVNKTTPSVEEIYNVVVNLTTAKTGKTLSKLNITAQPDDIYHDTDKEVFRAIDKTNTVVGDISETSTTAGKIVLNVPFSLYDKASTSDNNYTVIDYAGDNGGVVFGIQYENTGVEYIVFPITATVNDDKVSTPVTGSHISPEYVDTDGSNNTATNGNVFDRIIVLPEETARKVLTSATGYILSDADSKEGTIYTVENNQNAASHAASMTSMSIGNFNFTVTSKMDSSSPNEYTVSGTIPWSLTTDNGDSSNGGSFTMAGANPTFFDFEISPYAQMGSFNSSVSDTTVVFYPNGDSNNDGEEDVIVSNDPYTNYKLVFERNADHTVTVYQAGNDATTEIDGLLVKAEDRLDTGATKSVNKYYFNLKWAEPNTTADITAFSIGNSRGTIDNSNDKSRTINVTVPFGTDLKGLIPTFTASSGAKVRLNSSTTGTELQSGKTAVNFSHPVKLYVTSEDTKLTVEYTVTVNAAAQFSDVQPGAWYYDNVMRAVELGILSGYSDGTFRPMNNITRRDFAIMLAQAMGNSNDGEAVSPFIDVADDDYGVVSIAFLYEKQITVGDDQGKFNPDSYITRQEAAIFLARAFEATGTTSETFKDDAKIASWAKSFVYAAKAAGLMNGDTDGKFRPNDTLTRAEAASAMVNAVDK